MRKVLVALHPGYTHTPALDRAHHIAEQADVDVMLYSAVYDEHFAGVRFRDGTVMQGTRDLMVEGERQKLDEVKHDLSGIAKSVTVDAAWHYPAGQGIVAAAEAFDADLIIVSSTQHSLVSRWVLTNTDWDVLRHASIPVLLAHHHPFRDYKTVLAAVDPTHTHDEPAQLDHKIIERGRWLADCFAGTTHIVHAYPSQRTAINPEYVVPPEITAQWREEHTKTVNALAAAHDIESEHVHFLDEHVSRAIPELAKTLSADLVVMGVVSRGVVETMIIGRTAERVVDQLECDVLAVPVNRDHPDQRA